jgi:tetratricopeptide (TPR) repeat protein
MRPVSEHGPDSRTRRVLPLAVAIAFLGLAASLVAPATAQRGGESWRPLIPALKTQTETHPDPEVAFRLAMVYAHEGLLIDGWHMLKQVDRTAGGERHRAETANRIIAQASADIARDPRDLLARYSLAFASWLAGDHETPLREFREITRQDPQNAMNHGYLGYVYATRQDAKETIAQWEEGVRLDPSNSVLHYLLGSAYYRTGRTIDAAVQFNLAYRDRTLYNYITRGEEP